MLNFDWTADGINAADSCYVASGYTGIDFLIDAHYFQSFNISNHCHPIDLSEALKFATHNGLAAPYNFEYRTDVDGSGHFWQEWKVPTTFFTSIVGTPAGTPFTLYGSSMNVNPNAKQTYDTTSGLQLEVIPEPGMVSLLGLAGAVLTVYRKL